MSERVLLTGATGFIGRHCIPFLLEKGVEVHAVTNSDRKLKEGDVFLHRCDLLDMKEQGRLVDKVRPTHLLHLAWFASPGEYRTSIENIRWVEASLELLMNFHRCEGIRAVMAGTCYEYDWSYGYCSEHTTPTDPSTLYGACKDSLRQILEHFSRVTGLSTAWSRIFFLYGPHEESGRLVSSVIRSLLEGEEARCSHGRQIRDFLHVEDVASALVSLLGTKVSGPVNIASGLPVSLRDIVQMIAEKIHKSDLVRFGAIPPSSEEPPLLVADTRRLTEEVGWEAKYNLEEGLEYTIEWWRDNLFEK